MSIRLETVEAYQISLSRHGSVLVVERPGLRLAVIGDLTGLAERLAELVEDDDDRRECSRCGDGVDILNGRDECMACEEARANGNVCSRCGEDVDWDPGLGAYKENGVTICGSCAHNERRS